MMKSFIKNSKGIAQMLLPIVVLPFLALAYCIYLPINDTKDNADSIAAIAMDYNSMLNEITEPEAQTNPDDDIPVGSYQGFETYGTIRIPAINLEQEVISSVTADAIEVSCAYLYSNNGFNQVGNTVIIGHNYVNGTLFSNVPKLQVGDKIYLKTNGSEEIEYTIYNTFITTSSDASFYNRETSGKRELTLSTCTDDADTTDNRFIVEAREE